MRRLVIAGFVLVLAGLALYGQSATKQSFTVQYLDGSVQVQLKGQTAWKSLKVKDPVPADAKVKLAKGAMIELGSGTTVLSLIKEGEYAMTSLLAKVQTTSGGLGSTVAQKMKAIAGGKLVQQATTAGVNAKPDQDWSKGWYTAYQKGEDETYKKNEIARGNVPQAGFDIDNLQFFYWGIRGGYAERENPRMYEEYKDALDLGIRALIDAQYDVAIERLRSAVTAAIFPEEKRKASYLLASAYVEAGQPARAWKIVSDMSVTRDDMEYNDYLLRKAQLQVDAFQYDDALVTLKPLLESLVKDEFNQAACLVAYYAYQGLNRPQDATNVRKTGLNITVLFDDSKGNLIPVETEAKRILASLD